MGATLVYIFSTLRPEQLEDQGPSMSTGCFSFRYKSGLILSLILTFMWCKIGDSKSNVDVHRVVHRNIISVVKPTRCTNV